MAEKGQEKDRISPERAADRSLGFQTPGMRDLYNSRWRALLPRKRRDSPSRQVLKQPADKTHEIEPHLVNLVNPVHPLNASKHMWLFA